MVVLADFAVATSIVATAAAIDVADLNECGATIGFAIADFAFSLNTGLALGAAVAACTAVIRGIGGITAGRFTKALAVIASQAGTTDVSACAAVAVVGIGMDALATTLGPASHVSAGNTLAVVEDVAIFASGDGALAFDAAHSAGMLGFAGITMVGACATVRDVRADVYARAVTI